MDLNRVIQVTPAQIWAAVLSFCVGLSTIAAAIGWVIKCVQKVRAPWVALEKRLEALEIKNEEHEKKLNNDNNRLEAIEAGNRVLQEGMLALLEHGIDGNDVAALEKAKEGLQKFLINK